MTELNNSTEITEEIETYYLTRTMEHIHRVQKNALVLMTEYADVLDLNDNDGEYKRVFMSNIMRHDHSKFSAKQYKAYLIFSWKIKHGLELTDEEQEDFDDAWYNHFSIENHHPEDLNYSITYPYHNCDEISAKWRTKLALLECACDLQAMAQEFDEGNFENYYKTKWLPEQEEVLEDVGYDIDKINYTMYQVLKCFKDHGAKEKI